MSLLDRVIVVAMLALLLASAGMVVWAIIRQRQMPDHPMNRFKYGWLGAFAMMEVLVCSVGLSVIVAQTAPTTLTVLVAVIVNGLIQPIAILMLWMGARKIVRGFQGTVDYAGSRIEGESRSWVIYSTLRGVAFLVAGLGFVSVLAWPIVRWVLPSFP